MAVITFNGGGSGHTSNKGSCADLETYKEHEKALRAQEGRNQETNAKCCIFGADGLMTAEESIRLIDSHKKGLKKDEAKFYEFEINLSEGEQQAMFADLVTESSRERRLQDFVRQVVMEQYAQNFKGYTDKSGNSIEFHKEDICWTAVVHTERDGQEAQKWKKEHPGMQRADWHVHVTVAHRTMDQTRSISPKKNQRSSNKGSCQGYFDRNNFRQEAEKSIDKYFGYKRPIDDSLKGRLQKIASEEQRKVSSMNDVNCDQAKKQGHDTAISRIAAVRQRKHLEAERIRLQLEREAAERRAAAEAKRLAEQKAKEEAERKAAEERRRLEAIKAKEEAERKAAREAQKERISNALWSDKGQEAVSAVVANAKNMSRSMRYHISQDTGLALFDALMQVESGDMYELTQEIIDGAKRDMGSHPTNWVEMLRHDIEYVRDYCIDGKKQIESGEDYDNGIEPDDLKLGGGNGRGV